MVQFRPQAKEIIAKVVYYGPPLGGKTTNLRTLYRGYPANTRGELVVVPTGTDRTIFFDFLPVTVGSLRNMNLRVQLYTVPGQVHFNTTRQVVLRGVDGVVFVADSQREMLGANRTSYANLKENLILQGLALADLPHVVQYNKRDLKDILSVEELNEAVNETNAPFFEAVATVGIGVEETLQGVVRLVARSLRERFRLPLEAGATHDGLFTHIPSAAAGVERPFETAKLDAPVVRLATGEPAPPGGTGPRRTVSVHPPASQGDQVAPFPSGAGAARVEQSGAQGWREDMDEPVFAQVQSQPDPFAAAAAASLEAASGEVPVGEATEPDVFTPAVEPLAQPLPPAGEIPLLREEETRPPQQGGVFSAPPRPPVLAEAVDVPTEPAFIGQDVFAAGDAFSSVTEPLAPPLLIDPYADPFAEEVAVPPPCVADVFAVDGALVEGEAGGIGGTAPAGAIGEVQLFEPLTPRAVQVEVEEGVAAGGERLAPLPEAAVQRVLPRALAQFGEVRELELEVPVPAAWVGGRRMTLQLRLTLVPEEESYVG